jgi:hypothetical protein
MYYYSLVTIIKNRCTLQRYSQRLSPLAEDIVEVDQGQPVADVVVLVDTLNGLLAASLAELDGLHPALDVLLAGKLKHLLHLGAVTNVRCAHVVTVGSEDLGVEAWERVVWEADHVEGAVDLQGREVLGEVKLVCGIGGVDDEVKLELVLLVPALLAGEQEVLRAHLERVLLLACGVRDDVCLSTHGDGPEDTEVTKTSTVDC